MTLKELKILKKEYQEEINIFNVKALEEQIKINNKQKDDYAVEFANWLFNINKEVLNKQLKEFKKEKGL